MDKILLLYLDGTLIRKKMYVQEHQYPQYIWFGQEIPEGSIITAVWQDVHKEITSAEFVAAEKIEPGLIAVFHGGQLAHALLEDAPEHLRYGDAHTRLKGLA